MLFRDRRDAGRQLAQRLTVEPLGPLTAPIVLALPRGGVPVAAEVAAALDVPLDVFVARKIGAPGREELGVGAIAEGSDDVVVSGTARALALDASEMDALAGRERVELDRRVERYRQGRQLPRLTGRDVILVDDGLATGVTAEAALRALRRHEPHRLVLAVPVCAPDTRNRLVAIADHILCLAAPPQFAAVGAWYANFDQTPDEEVAELLSRSRSAVQR